MEHRPLRRKDRQLPQEEALEILSKGTYGVMAVTGDEGWPYAVPMSYIWVDGAIYLHCARNQGHMLASIARDPRVCFTVVTRNDVIREHITTLYESVVVFGTADLVEDETDRLSVMEALVDILSDVPPEIKAGYIQSKGARTGLVKITPTHITGKANKAYVPVTERM